MTSLARTFTNRIGHSVRRLLGDVPIYVLHHRPLIVTAYWHDFHENLREIAAFTSKNEPLIGFFQLGWEAQSDERVKTIAGQVLKAAETLPRLTVKFLANSPTERDSLSAAGLDAIFCNQNAFLDWDRYRINPDVKPTFDAVYLARITPFKRHDLARNVKSLYLIGEYRDSEADFGKQTLASLTHHRERKVPSRHVPREIQRAHVGLCLSKVEGAMFVSLEYLLSGRPVVSTESIGGRDTFFGHDAAAIVDDTPEAVAAGVRRMKETPVDHAAIREMCVEKMREHRGFLTTAVEELLDHHGERARFQEAWSRVYTHKLALRCWPTADASPARLPIKGLSASALEKLARFGV